MEKAQLKVYIDKKLLEELWNHIKTAYPRSTYGALSSEVQQAIAAWLKTKHTQIHTNPMNPGTPRVHQICTQIIQTLKTQGFINQVDKRTLSTTISEIRGSDERTITKWIKILVKNGYIKILNPNLYELL